MPIRARAWSLSSSGSDRQPTAPGSAQAAAALGLRAEQLRMSRDDVRSDPFRVAVRRQIRPREENLPATGRNGDEPIEHDRIPGRPRGNHHDLNSTERTGQPPVHSARPPPMPRSPGDTTKAPRATRQIPEALGPESCSTPRSEPPVAPRRALGRPLPRGRQDRAREQGGRQWFAHRHALVLEEGRIDGNGARANQARERAREATRDQIGEEDREVPSRASTSRASARGAPCSL